MTVEDFKRFNHEGVELSPSERLAHVLENGGLGTLSDDERQSIEADFRANNDTRPLEDIVGEMQHEDNPMNTVF